MPRLAEVDRDIQGGDDKDEEEPREHEPEAGQQPAEPAAAEHPEVDGELVRLGPGQDLVDGQQSVEALAGDPPLLVDELLPEHRDLGARGRPTASSPNRTNRANRPSIRGTVVEGGAGWVRVIGGRAAL